MKLNNKGFAITAVLYGLLILFVFFVGSYLIALSAKKDRVEDIINDIENEYNGAIYTEEDDEFLLVKYISDLYNDAEKTVITNNSIGYNYATLTSLMNDRLGGVSTDYNGGNIRYYGADPNNYIDIGDRDSSGDVILWRIIGVFKDIELEDGTTDSLIKVVRDESIGKILWDDKASGNGTSISSYGSNNWSDSKLMMLLNPGYENGANDSNGNSIYSYEGSLYWNSRSGTCYSNTPFCNFNSSGLSTNARNKVEMVVWNLGGTNYSGVYANQIYGYERGTNRYDDTRDLEWTGKIALIYPSDYGYAADFSGCSSNLLNYGNNVGCYENNWLFNSDYEWTLLSSSQYSDRSFIIGSAGGGYTYTLASMAVKPTMFLKSDLILKSGAGLKKDPYVV